VKKRFIEKVNVMKLSRESWRCSNEMERSRWSKPGKSSMTTNRRLWRTKQQRLKAMLKRTFPRLKETSRRRINVLRTKHFCKSTS